MTILPGVEKLRAAVPRPAGINWSLAAGTTVSLPGTQQMTTAPEMQQVSDASDFPRAPARISLFSS